MFIVINVNTDVVRSKWESFDDAETAAAEANADYPNANGPWMAVSEEEYA